MIATANEFIDLSDFFELDGPSADTIAIRTTAAPIGSADADLILWLRSELQLCDRITLSPAA